MTLLRPFERLADALADPERRERTAAYALIGYCVLWWLYAIGAKSSQDIHFDMGEMAVWSREVGLGTAKHPPFGAWLARLWFSAFPLADWSYYLLTMVLATFALWVAWRISARYLDVEKRIAGVVLLTFIPFFNFQALKYNANSILIPLWAVATWFFLRSYETRNAGWAALAGLAAAAAMLSKYWSIFLLAGLGVAVLCDSRRGAYFRSAAPWITVAVGGIALAPHLWWIVAHDFAPFTYALTVHQATRAEALISGLGFLAGVAGYAAPAAIIAALAAWPSLPALADTVWPATGERRFILIAFLGPLVLPAVAAAVVQTGIVSLWAIGAMTLLPVVLLSSPLVNVSRKAVAWLLFSAVALSIAMILASPVIALWLHREGVPNHSAHYRLLAAEVEKAWRGTTERPLRFLGSTTELANGVSFYLVDRPATFEVTDPRGTPWADAASVARDGIAYVCAADEFACMQTVANRAGDAKRSEVVLSRSYLGAPDKPVRYVIAIVPPQGR